MTNYTPVTKIAFDDIGNIIDEYLFKKNNTVYPIIDKLIIMLNEKIANRDLNTFSRGHLFDSWYFWQKIHYTFIGFKLTYSKNDTTLTNWDCAIILKRELKKINPLADITVEVISGDNDNNMVLINIGLREDGKPFEQTYVY